MRYVILLPTHVIVFGCKPFGTRWLGPFMCNKMDVCRTWYRGRGYPLFRKRKIMLGTTHAYGIRPPVGSLHPMVREKKLNWCSERTVVQRGTLQNDFLLELVSTEVRSANQSLPPTHVSSCHMKYWFFPPIFSVFPLFARTHPLFGGRALLYCTYSILFQPEPHTHVFKFYYTLMFLSFII